MDNSKFRVLILIFLIQPIKRELLQLSVLSYIYNKIIFLMKISNEEKMLVFNEIEK